LFRRFAVVNTTLWILPGMLTIPFCPKHLSLVVTNHYADIGPKPFGIDHTNLWRILNNMQKILS
jgi:hypothetical protein